MRTTTTVNKRESGVTRKGDRERERERERDRETERGKGELVVGGIQTSGLVMVVAVDPVVSEWK